jgi:hypothetical protein
LGAKGVFAVERAKSSEHVVVVGGRGLRGSGRGVADKSVNLVTHLAEAAVEDAGQAFIYEVGLGGEGAGGSGAGGADLVMLLLARAAVGWLVSSWL